MAIEEQKFRIKMQGENKMSEHYISLVEWAKKNGISDATARQKASKGLLPTAKKIGRNWVICGDAPNIDNRKKVKEQ